MDFYINVSFKKEQISLPRNMFIHSKLFGGKTFIGENIELCELVSYDDAMVLSSFFVDPYKQPNEKETDVVIRFLQKIESHPFFVYIFLIKVLMLPKGDVIHHHDKDIHVNFMILKTISRKFEDYILNFSNIPFEVPQSINHIRLLRFMDLIHGDIHQFPSEIDPEFLNIVSFFDCPVLNGLFNSNKNIQAYELIRSQHIFESSSFVKLPLSIQSILFSSFMDIPSKDIILKSMPHYLSFHGMSSISILDSFGPSLRDYELFQIVDQIYEKYSIGILDSISSMLGNTQKEISRIEIEIKNRRLATKYGKYINHKPFFFEKDLHIASFKGKIESVIYLINHGADVDSRYCGDYYEGARVKGCSPLFFAIMNNQIDIVFYLVNNKASINALSDHIKITLI